jgi:hypothetical protein
MVNNDINWYYVNPRSTLKLFESIYRLLYSIINKHPITFMIMFCIYIICLFILFAYLYIIKLDNKIIYYQFMKNNFDMNFIN